MNSYFINPQTKDYERQNGGFRKTKSEAPTVALILKTPLGSCIVAPELGHRFAQIELALPETERRFVLETERALALLIDEKRIRDLTVTVDVSGSTIRGIVSFKDAAGSQQVSFTGSN